MTSRVEDRLRALSSQGRLTIRRVRRRLTAGPKPAKPAKPPAQITGSQPRPVAPPCPSGWKIGPPDYVIVGAEKSGTSRWARLLREHPDVFITPGIREIHYWDDFAGRWPTHEDIEGYHRFFPRPPGGMIGEKTPQYMNLWWIPAMLAAAAPQARIIVLLRDPVDRYVSGRTQLEKYRDENRAMGMTDAEFDLRSVERAFHRGQYALQVRWILDAYPADQVLVLQYEECVADTLGQLARTLEFIGLPPYMPTPQQLEKEVNLAWMEKVSLEPERRDLMRRLYEPEVLRLKEIVPGLDLTLWPNFAHIATGAQDTAEHDKAEQATAEDATAEDATAEHAAAEDATSEHAAAEVAPA